MVFTKRLFAVLMIFVMLLGFVGMNATTVLAEGEGNSASVPFPTGKAPDGATPDIQKVDNDSALAQIVGTMYKFGTYISGLIFGVAVIIIVWAGFKYATSQGEQKTMEQAKMQIIAAGIGIGIALFAMLIVKIFAEIYNVA